MFSSQNSQVSLAANYIEDVFSTYLYTGNGSTQTINNGIDLAGKGGLVWTKSRNNVSDHSLADTNRGAFRLLSNDTSSQLSLDITYNSNGFTMGVSGSQNASGYTYASWTFRKQPKFFDVVTYTGNGSARTIAHNLGSVPGCIIVKRTDSGTADNWQVYHRSLNNTQYLSLNTQAAASSAGDRWNSTTATDTVFSIGTQTTVNASGGTFVAYLFAHDAGGFGLTGTDNVISCGSYTGNGSTSGPIVTLGYEPQWLFVKRTDGASNWILIDNMRGFVNSTSATPSDAYLVPNLADAENTWGTFTGTENAAIPLATGFQIVTSVAALNINAGPYIYIAIRRGPMKTPTSGTSVFSPLTRTGTRAAGSVTGIGFPPDNLITLVRGGGSNPEWNNKLVGPTKYLRTSITSSEATSTDLASYDQNGVSFNATDFNSNVNNTVPLIQYFLRRATGFMDVVCYTGDGVAGRAVTHNLGVAPEFLIVKRRSGADSWYCYAQPLGNTYDILLDSTRAATNTDDIWFSTSPTSTTFTVRQYNAINGSGQTYVAYLFASATGVSKVGSYTGTGALQTVNCGFAAGARFVLIKRTDSTGDWYVWDSARGISSGNDPYLLINSTAAEVTGTNYVDTTAVGFQVTAAAPAALNASGGTYIFLAIA